MASSKRSAELECYWHNDFFLRGGINIARPSVAKVISAAIGDAIVVLILERFQPGCKESSPSFAEGWTAQPQARLEEKCGNLTC